MQAKNEIKICDMCNGTKRRFEPPADFYELDREGKMKYNHAAFYFECEGCNGTGITNADILEGKEEVELVRDAEGIFGMTKSRIRIAKKGENAWDAWIEDSKGKMKKLTRGTKYILAKNLAGAVCEMLSGGEYRGNGIGRVLSIN